MSREKHGPSRILISAALSWLCICCLFYFDLFMFSVSWLFLEVSLVVFVCQFVVFCVCVLFMFFLKVFTSIQSPVKEMVTCS